MFNHGKVYTGIIEAIALAAGTVVALVCISGVLLILVAAGMTP